MKIPAANNGLKAAYETLVKLVASNNEHEDGLVALNDDLRAIDARVSAALVAQLAEIDALRERVLKLEARPPAPVPEPSPPVPPPPSPNIFVQKSAWVTVPGNAPPDHLVPLMAAFGAKLLILPVAWGLDGRYDAVLPRLVDLAKRLGFVVAGSAWATGNSCFDEGKFHAHQVLRFGLAGLVSEIEEAFDAHGDWSNTVKRERLASYRNGVRSRAGSLPFAAAVTPRWAGWHDLLFQVDAVLMPEAYPQEENGETIEACVAHAKAYGWPLERVCPLVGLHDGQRSKPAPEQVLGDARAAGVRYVSLYPASAPTDEATERYWRVLGQL